MMSEIDTALSGNDNNNGASSMFVHRARAQTTPIRGRRAPKSSGGVHILCSDCGTPIMEAVSGSIIIKSRHHGRRHITKFPIDVMVLITEIAKSGSAGFASLITEG